MKPNTVLRIPDTVRSGWLREQQSRYALRWLEWTAKKNDIRISTAANNVLEKRLLPNGVRVDGFCRETNTVYEVNGCFFHGCIRCYNLMQNCAHPFYPGSGITFGDLRERQRRKEAELKAAGYTVVSMWCCEIEAELKCDKEMREWFNRNIGELDPDPIYSAREGYFGGRTETNVLHCSLSNREIESGYRIKYYDICSLYPYVMSSGLNYPVGGLQIIPRAEINQETFSVDDYCGLIKCRVIPPEASRNRSTFPYLPFKHPDSGHLMFAYCFTCAKEGRHSWRREGSELENEFASSLALDDDDDDEERFVCQHSETQRSWVGTYTTVDLKEALSEGYRYSEIREIWNFSETSDDLFHDFIEYFAKEKYIHSKYESEAARRDFFRQLETEQGIAVSEDELMIEPDPARRTMAKLSSNSLYGKNNNGAVIRGFCYVLKLRPRRRFFVL